MRDHRLSVPLCALEVASAGTPERENSRPSAFRSGTSSNLSLLLKQQELTATACGDPLEADMRAGRMSASVLSAGANVEARTECCSKQRKDAPVSGGGGPATAGSSLSGTRRNSSVIQESVAPSTSPDGSYLSSPFFSGSPVDFPETLQPRVLSVSSDVQCSLSTPLEKFFGAMESPEMNGGAQASPIATVCTHHTTSPAAEAFPLNGSSTQETDEAEKSNQRGAIARLSSDSVHGGSAFPIRPHDSTSSPGKEDREGAQHGSDFAMSHRRYSSGGRGEKLHFTSSAASSGEEGAMEEASAAPPEFFRSSSAVSTGGDTLVRGDPSLSSPADSPEKEEALASGLPVSVSIPSPPPRSAAPLSSASSVAFSGEDTGSSDADRLLVDFQLLLILLFDQVCNVVPGLRRQDGGAFYSMHVQRIAGGPLHPTLASYADVLLPVCSAMNFFSNDSDGGGGSSSREQKQDKSGRQEEQESILSVTLRYLARHGTIPAAPIAEMVSKCPAAVFIQVVSALECMYSLQRILAPGKASSPPKPSEELDPKTIWGDAVAEMEKAATVLAEECMTSSPAACMPSSEEAEDSNTLPSSSGGLAQPPKRPRALAAEPPLVSSRRPKSAGNTMPMLQGEAHVETRAVSSNALGKPPVGDLNAASSSVSLSLAPQGGLPSNGVAADPREGGVPPAFIPASVNKRRHPNIQAEILSSCCPERLAQRGTRLLGEVLQKLQSEQAVKPAPPHKNTSPKQALLNGSSSAEQPEAGNCHLEAVGAGASCGGSAGSGPMAEGESDSVSSCSVRAKRKMSGGGEQSLGEALAQLAALQQQVAVASDPSAAPAATPEAEETQGDAASASDGQLKKHGYGLRRSAAKKGRKSFEDGIILPPRGGGGRGKLTPIKGHNPQQTRGRTPALLSPSEGGSQQDPSTTSLPPNLTEQLMKLASGAEGDFPAALSSTMRGVFFNRSLNRWVCTWSRNGKEYQRSWSAGKYGYETARGLAMHCRLEKLLSGEAHTLQKGMLAVFKPIVNSPALAHATSTSPADPSASTSVCKSESGEVGGEEATVERRRAEAQRPRISPRPANRLETGASKEGDLVGSMKMDAECLCLGFTDYEWLCQLPCAYTASRETMGNKQLTGPPADHRTATA
ncbi:hypothetical protein cyc_00750 [Cyclospora cayetanensis]|uniref:AP2/ERF domain-containing protein n=1 Tax=Cyclospora cayetanensis TaxID=88456 RepID=A0A1D3CV00_9EIME|nr:hypothetical protein cyc_00750 [Cyclospora cayetanensis]